MRSSDWSSDVCSSDLHAAVQGKAREVAVAPDVGMGFEIGGTVLAAVRVVPEPYRHARERRQARQLAGLIDNWFAGLIEHRHLHAKATALQFAAIHRQQR